MCPLIFNTARKEDNKAHDELHRIERVKSTSARNPAPKTEQATTVEFNTDDVLEDNLNEAQMANVKKWKLDDQDANTRQRFERRERRKERRKTGQAPLEGGEGKEGLWGKAVVQEDPVGAWGGAGGGGKRPWIVKKQPPQTRSIRAPEVEGAFLRTMHLCACM